MNRNMKIIYKMMFLFYLSLMLTGCSSINHRIDQYSEGKEKCILDSNDVTKF